MCRNQALYDAFAGGPGPLATYEHMLELMNQLNLFPDRNLLPPEAISAAGLWLASEEARHLTGCALPVDAGYLTRYNGYAYEHRFDRKLIHGIACNRPELCTPRSLSPSI